MLSHICTWGLASAFRRGMSGERAGRLDGQGVFLSTYEKQLDGKRRLLIPQEFRTADNGAEHGVFCFFSVEADCLEAGGDKLMAEYVALIESLPFGDDWRTALEETVYGGQKPLAYDGGGRITLPEALAQEAGLGEDVVIVGLGSRFQIWDRDRWASRKDERRQMARTAMRARGAAARRAMPGNDA
jgi:MraZ protein